MGVAALPWASLNLNNGDTMSDLSADYATLNRVRHNLDHIAELMRKPGREMEHCGRPREKGSATGSLSAVTLSE
ncbi:hypothetical protein SUDANB21_03940 [Streptomyces sp. enrichment culture]